MPFSDFADLTALVGPFIQTFIAWVFVAILALMRTREERSHAFESFFRALLALALSLTALSWRFAHPLGNEMVGWLQGDGWPVTCFAVYMGFKAWFALELVRGSWQLASAPEPTMLRWSWWPIVLLSAAFPVIFPDRGLLVMVQAPIIIACSLASLRGLAHVPARGSGLALVRGSLVAMAISRTIHALAVWDPSGLEFMIYVRFLNSLPDLGVQLILGMGLVATLVQEAYHRLGELELDRQRLRESIERDERLRALGTLVSGVAHELNNPLTVIQGYAELIRRKTPDDPSIRIVEEQAERCRGIVRSLSALAGHSVHPSEDIEVSDLIERVVRGLARRKDSDRVLVGATSGLAVSGDRVGLEQVLTNLVQNALQASGPDEPVGIDARETDAGVILTVSDRGPGVPPELRARLFDPFFTTKGPGKGTGLGLSIAHAIVRRHGGRIMVEDGPGGRGSLFSVLLPRGEGGVQTRPKIDAAPRARSLMIIDDDDAVRSVVRDQAEARGWSVVEAASAELALSASPGIEEVDAVLCDMRMPGMGGAGLHAHLTKTSPGLLQRVVFATGDLASREVVRFVELHRESLVPKPFEFNELFRRLLASAEGSGSCLRAASE